MKKNYFLMLAAILFSVMGLLTSCSSNDDGLTDEELFEQEMAVTTSSSLSIHNGKQRRTSVIATRNIHKTSCTSTGTLSA